jgi:hypothetical protein
VPILWRGAAITTFYSRLAGAGKPKEAAIAARMRKRLTFLNAMALRQTLG